MGTDSVAATERVETDLPSRHSLVGVAVRSSVSAVEIQLFAIGYASGEGVGR